MQVSVESEKGIERRLKVAIPAAKLSQEVRTRIGTIGRKARVPGFRPGRAPHNVLMQRYGAQAREEAVNELIRSGYLDALKETELMPAGAPNIELGALPAEGEDLQFTAVFDVYPDITLDKLDQLNVKRSETEIADADIDRVVASLRDQHKRYETVARAAAEGDRIVIDFAGSVDGEAFEGGSSEDFETELGAGRLLPDMEQSFAGHQAGDEYTVDVNFPDNYAKEELQGKTAQFKINIKSVAAAKLPELDDEFFKTLEIDGGEAALRTKISESLRRQADDTIQQRVKQQLFDGLLENHPTEAPRGMVGEEIERMRHEQLSQLPAQLRNDFARDPDKLRQLIPDAHFADAAKRRVALGLLVGEVVKVADIKLDAERVSSKLESMAADYGKPDEVIAHYRGNPQLMRQLEAMVLEEQVVDTLLDKATVETVTTDFEALMQPPHGEPGHEHGPDCEHDHD